MNEITKISARPIKKPIILKKYNRFSKNKIIATSSGIWKIINQKIPAAGFGG